MQREINHYLRNQDAHKPTEKDHNLRFCNECENVWETYWMSGAPYFNKYSELPSIGLKREICQKCQPEKTIDQAID